MIAFVILGTLLFSVMLACIYGTALNINDYGGGLNSVVWVGVLLLFITVGTVVFGMLALLISKLNPSYRLGNLILLPFVILLVLSAAYRIFEITAYRFESNDPPVVSTICLLIALVFMSFKLFRMLTRNPYMI